MARIIRFDADSPAEVKPSEHSVWVCQCGLSQNKPLCDGSHVRVRREVGESTYVYDEVTQEPIAKLDGISNVQDLLQFQQSRDIGSLAKGGVNSAFVVRRILVDSDDFESVLRLRAGVSQNGSVVSDKHDRTASIYVMEDADGNSMATMRVNQARDGQLDCEEFFPNAFVEKYRPFVCSASRFARAKSIAANFSLMSDFIGEVWRLHFAAGIRADVINVHLPMVPYYSRLGYYLLEDSYFVHPRLGTDSVVMVFFTDPREHTRFSRIFDSQVDFAFLDHMRSELSMYPKSESVRVARELSQKLSERK